MPSWTWRWSRSCRKWNPRLAECRRSWKASRMQSMHHSRDCLSRWLMTLRKACWKSLLIGPTHLSLGPVHAASTHTTPSKSAIKKFKSFMSSCCSYFNKPKLQCACDWNLRTQWPYDLPSSWNMSTLHRLLPESCCKIRNNAHLARHPDASALLRTVKTSTCERLLAEC
jgi:hypothetical protein